MAFNIQRQTSNIANYVIYDSSGNVVIGAGVPHNKLEVVAASSTPATLTSGMAVSDGVTNRTILLSGINAANYSYLQSWQQNIGALPLSLNANGGNVGIKTATPSYDCDVTGTIRATGDVIAFSDASVKENVETIDNALEKVLALRGVTYVRNDIEDKSTKMGVIAQEVKKIIPEVVQVDDDGKHSVSYGNIVGLLIEAIKEMQIEIDLLKNK